MQDRSNEFFLGPEFDHWIKTPHIRVWPWEAAPKPVKDALGDGDEDGAAWIPNQFLTEDLLGGTSYAPITQLWRNDDSPEFVRFRDGLLVIWRHA